MDLTSAEFTLGVCIGIVVGVFGTLFSFIAAERRLSKREGD